MVALGPCSRLGASCCRLQNNPLFVQTYRSDNVVTGMQEDPIKFHYILHCSLDAFEEKGASSCDNEKNTQKACSPALLYLSCASRTDRRTSFFAGSLSLSLSTSSFFHQEVQHNQGLLLGPPLPNGRLQGVRVRRPTSFDATHHPSNAPQRSGWF